MSHSVAAVGGIAISPPVAAVGFTTIAIAAAAMQSDANVFQLGFIVVLPVGKISGVCDVQQMEQNCGAPPIDLKGSKACRVRLRIAHRPSGLGIRSIFIAIPRRSADVEVGVGRSGEHDPRAGIANGRRKTAVPCVKGPQDHPVRADRDRWAGVVERRVIAVLGCTTQHITESWCPVCRSRFSSECVLEPLHAELVDTHRRIADRVFISGDAKPFITAFAQYCRPISLVIHFGLRGAVFGLLLSAASYTGAMGLGFFLNFCRQPFQSVIPD